MDKSSLVEQIIARLTADLATLSGAARAAHEAATHEECAPDNKYDTTALEASYIAQGQANRAAAIRLALERYRALALRDFDDSTPVRLTAMITLEAEDGTLRRLFIGPEAGGLKLLHAGEEWVVVTPEAPLGRALLGKRSDDEIVVGEGSAQRVYTLLEVC